jgi:hypothetical protein
VYIEFSNNSSSQESLKMEPFEMLYGHRCRTPLFLNKAGEQKFLDLTYCKKAKEKYIWHERTYRLRIQDRRAIRPLAKRIKF